MNNRKRDHRRPSPQARRKPSPPTAWDAPAEWYDQLVGDQGSEYQQKVVHPGVLRLLDIAPGQPVLDIACGQGVLCRLLHQAGGQVTGVDASGELIRLARQRSDPAIHYHVADARKLSQFPPASFAAATCVLAIQNIHPIQPVFDHVVRITSPGGRFILAMMHPCFRGPKQTSWGWDEAATAQYRRVDRYLMPRKEPIVTHPGKNPKAYTWTFHRPVGAYVKALVGAGLLVDAMEEWVSHKYSVPGPRAAAENTARREIPLFMAIRATKRDVGAA